MWRSASSKFCFSRSPDNFSCRPGLLVLIVWTLLYKITIHASSLVDSSFDVGQGATSATGEEYSIEVNALAIQDDGKIIVGGSFASFAGIPCSGIVRLNTD